MRLLLCPYGHEHLSACAERGCYYCYACGEHYQRAQLVQREDEARGEG